MDLLDRFISVNHPSDSTIRLVRDYFAWQANNHAMAFAPSAEDDIDLRTYLLFLRTNGADMAVLEEHITALKQFYQWALTEGGIVYNPFDESNFLHPFLTSEQLVPRPQTLSNDHNIRELDRMRGLDKIVEQLIRSVDIHTAIESTLKTLLEVMNLQTGWVSLHNDYRTGVIANGKLPPHGFTLAAAYGLPPGLENDDRIYLRQPPACRCQRLLLEGRLTRPVNIVECTRLHNSTNAAGDNRGLRFHASAPLISHGKPVGLLNTATVEWQFLTHEDLDFLLTVSSRLVAAIERAHFYEIAEQQRIHLQNELNLAHQVQVGLMPHTRPDIPGFDLAWAWHPAREVAGDFYNVFLLSEHRWGIMIGDVADKGTAAALYMAMVHSLILSGALRHRSPSAVLREVNRTILKQASAGIFVTAFLGVLNTRKRTLQFANAGHNPPIIRRASGAIETLTRTGSVLGVVKDFQLVDATITFGKKDAILLYTDGVTEACDTSECDENYGETRLIEAASDGPQAAEELLAHIESDLNLYSNGTARQDDVTLMVLTKE